MRSYSRKRKNNIIIGTLCGVMLLMVVGYAAFASQLNVKGTSGISSNWDIEITGIRGGNPLGGDAYDISEPTYTPTTATFNTGLKTPGTWRMYEVEVTNKGTLTGLVTIANLSCGDNNAIGCGAFAFEQKQFDEQWGESNTDMPSIPFEQGQQDYTDIAFTLAPGEKHYIYVLVGYNDVTSQPENLSANINLELTYEQAVDDGEGNVFPNRYLTATFEKGENVVSISENSASCKATINKENESMGCSIVLPQIKGLNGHIGYWCDQDGNKIGEPGDSYTITENTTLITKTVAPLPNNGIVYSMSQEEIKLGDTKIIDYTSDYTTLNSDAFLKHIITNGQVESSEVCFIKEGLHCLKPNEYEISNNTLSNIFNSEDCHISSSDQSFCKLQWNTHVRTFENGEVSADDNYTCHVYRNGTAVCGELPSV